MVESKITRLCGCGCGFDIQPRTPRKMQRDLEKSLSGRLFLNRNHFGRWTYRHKLAMERERQTSRNDLTTEELWESMVKTSDVLRYRREKAGEPPMGNLLDLIQETESSSLGGHSAPTNSNFKEKSMTQPGDKEIQELEERIAKLKAEQGVTPDAMPYAEATRQNLESNQTGGMKPFDILLTKEYPDNKVVSRCVNNMIKVGNINAWTYDIDAQGKEVKQIITETELPICRAEKGIWKLETDGHYMQVTTRPDSIYADTHCFCCSSPIGDGIMDASTPPRPKHWGPNTGVMTEHQLGYRWSTYDGLNAPTHNKAGVPLPNSRWFTGTLQEYIEHQRAKYPLGETPKPAPAPPQQTPMDLGQGQVEADLNDDLPPGI